MTLREMREFAERIDNLRLDILGIDEPEYSGLTSKVSEQYLLLTVSSLAQATRFLRLAEIAEEDRLGAND